MESYLLVSALIIFTISFYLQLANKNKPANLFILGAVFVHFIALIVRSVIAKHPPFTNMYETFILLPFLLSLRLIFWKEQINEKVRKILTAVIMGTIIIALLLPQSMKSPRPLMPALNSIWMYIHVPSYFLGYMAMLVAGIYSVLILLPKKPDNSTVVILKRMDNEVKIAFFFLSLGMITGAIWAYVSWGNYWAWDPKETWALINIIVLAFYFHLKTPTKQKKAVIVIITLLTIAFTYWGVSFILSGLHSYTL